LRGQFVVQPSLTLAATGYAESKYVDIELLFAALPRHSCLKGPHVAAVRPTGMLKCAEVCAHRHFGSALDAQFRRVPTSRRTCLVREYYCNASNPLLLTPTSAVALLKATNCGNAIDFHAGYQHFSATQPHDAFKPGVRCAAYRTAERPDHFILPKLVALTFSRAANATHTANEEGRFQSQTHCIAF
jgi:hypothetical protein